MNRAIQSQRQVECKALGVCSNKQRPATVPAPKQIVSSHTEPSPTPTPKKKLVKARYSVVRQRAYPMKHARAICCTCGEMKFLSLRSRWGYSKAATGRLQNVTADGLVSGRRNSGVTQQCRELSGAREVMQEKSERLAFLYGRAKGAGQMRSMTNTQGQQSVN